MSVPAAQVVEPDVQFIRNVVRSGGGGLKKCYQCATCSVACALSTDEAPFPRRQMAAAQWGLKEKLVGDAALWRCHACGDCTTQCPRGARPGDVLNAVRREAIRHFAFPRFMGNLVADARSLLLLWLLPAVIFVLMAKMAPGTPPGHPSEFAHWFPIPQLEALFFTVAGLVLITFGVGLARFIQALRAGGADAPILPNLGPVLVELMAHRRFSQCGGERKLFWGHLLTMWGFAGLAAVGTIIGIGSMTGLVATPLEQTNPLKIFANLGAVVILIGGLILLAGRAGDPRKRQNSTYFDWFFLLTLVGVIFTGIVSQFLRLAQESAWMYPVYFVHLVLVFALFLYAPYSKFAHIVYRTVALAAARTGGPRGLGKNNGS